MNTAKCPVMETIAKKLIGIDSVPIGERVKMIKRAAKAGADAVKKQLETELAEARAEIERLKKELRDNNYQAVRQIIPAEMAAEDGQLEIQRLSAECNKLDTECNKLVKRLREKEEGFAITLRHMSIQIERKDKLIEQMREALKFSLVADEIRQARNVCASDINDACETSRIKRAAALSAAERGE